MKSKKQILIVDDDRSTLWILDKALKSWGYKTVLAETAAEARREFTLENCDAVLLDIELPDGSGLDVLSSIKKEQSEALVIMVTGNVDVQNTIAAMRGGAHDFISKPVNIEELRVTLSNSLETKQLRKEVRAVRRERAEQFSFEHIIGESESLKKAIQLASRVASSDIDTVLLQGETGTGKDLFARAIHQASERAEAPYLAINCAALPANLVESELFGHEKGAFTDAKARKEGLFEQAQGGTIFLDEIGEMELNLQAKLLRVLEEKRFRRVGGLKDLILDARIVAASNLNLKAECAEKRFRLDLYYRLSVIQIDIPPLRDRGKDVLLLADHYIKRINHKRRGAKLKGLAKDTARLFMNYEWLGNVRELRNVIERASILEDGEFITGAHLPVDLIGANSLSAADSSSIILPPAGIPMREAELHLIRQALERENGNLTRAARLLHISRDQLRYRIKKAKTHATNR